MSKRVDVKSIVSYGMKIGASEILISGEIGSIYLNLFSNGYSIEVAYEGQEYMELVTFVKHHISSYDQSVLLHRIFSLKGEINVKHLDCFFNEIEGQSYSFKLGDK